MSDPMKFPMKRMAARQSKWNALTYLHEREWTDQEESCSDWQPSDDECPATSLFPVKLKYAHNDHDSDVDSDSDDIPKSYIEDRKWVHIHSEHIVGIQMQKPQVFSSHTLRMRYQTPAIDS